MVSTPSTPAVVRANGDASRKMVSYGWFAFRRTGAMVPFKGALAHDALTVFAVDPDLVEITKRVPYVQWYDGSRWRAHPPRYALRLRRRRNGPDSVVLVDVLWSWEMDKAQVKFDRLRLEAAERNLDYRIFTEQDVRVEPLLSNARFIQKFAGRGVVPKDVLDAVRGFADGRGSFSVDEAVDAGVLAYPDAYAGALHLVAHGEMKFDLGRRFDGRSRVRWRRRL